MIKKISMCGVMLCLWLQPALVAAQAKRQLPEGDGRATTQRLCGTCHGAEIVLDRNLTEEAWGDIVANMVQRGAQGTEDELYEVVAYLSKLPKSAAPDKINVNKASATDLEVGLEISRKEAEAIVRAREKGEIKSLEDLKKVPGLDPGKIDAKKNRLTFQPSAKSAPVDPAAHAAH